MSKSYVQELRQVYDALLTDAEYAYPTLRGEFERDRIRLASAVTSRGLPVFLIDLPAAGKHLDRCLADGQYKESGLPLTRRVSGSVPIPKLFRGLYLLIFDRHGDLKEEPDAQAILFLRTILYCAKKATVPCPEEATRKTVADFYETDASLPKPSWFWGKERARLSDLSYLPLYETAERYSYEAAARRLFEEKTEDEQKVAAEDPGKVTHATLLENASLIAGIMNATIGRYHWSKSKFKHGPGSVSDVPKGLSKYTWVSWPARLEHMFPIAECGYADVSDWAFTAQAQVATEWVFPTVYPLRKRRTVSKLYAVLKSYKKARLIASEPASGQWCQQNVKHFLYRQVERSWIGEFLKFEDQTLNQGLALLGSREGSRATVDLTEASDRVSTLAVECQFRSSGNLLLALQATRTPYLSQDICEDLPEIYRLRKFSTMGNACTFPVESIIFLTMALAAVVTKRGWDPKKGRVEQLTELAGEVAVFGDDIIVPTDCRALMVWGLEVLDFRVNTAKSYWTGKFRESCGVDAFDGVNVTPVYWKAPFEEKPESLVRTLATANNFYKKFFVSTSGFLSRTVTKWRMPLVRWEDGSHGLISFVVPSSATDRKVRWNEELQREEILVPVPIGRVSKTLTHEREHLLQFYTERPLPLSKWSRGVDGLPELKIKLRWRPRWTYTSRWTSLGEEFRVYDYYRAPKGIGSQTEFWGASCRQHNEEISLHREFATPSGVQRLHAAGYVVALPTLKGNLLSLYDL